MKYKIALHLWSIVMRIMKYDYIFYSYNEYKNKIGICYREKSYRGIIYWGKMFAKKKLFAPVRFVCVKLLNLLYRVIYSHPAYKSFFENLRKVE